MGIFKKKKVSARRIKQIVKILVKYGFNVVAEKARIKPRIPFLSPPKEEFIDKRSRNERIRLILEDLGAPYVKLGQILSTRPDLVGGSLSVELAKLQDNVKPVEFEEVEKEFKEEFGKPIKEMFKSFERTPIASASLAQVHRAVTKEGDTVVVKVQRPGIEETIKEDIQIMHYLAELAEKYNQDWKHYRMPEIVEEFQRSLKKELNFGLEGKNIEHFQDIFDGDKRIVIPEYYRELSTGKILTMSYINGTSLSEIIAGKQIKGLDKPLLARTITSAYFKQLLEHGFFHADLHPGNIIILPGNRIAFVDFGMIGWVEKDKIDELTRLFTNLIHGDVSNLMLQLQTMDLIKEDTNIEALKEDISDLMESYYGIEMQEANLGKSATELMMILRRYQIRIPKEYTMLSRSLFLIEGSAAKLDPEFNAMEIFKPSLIKISVKKISPKEIINRLKTQFFEIEALSRTLPRTIRNILRVVESGKIKLEFEHKNLDNFAEKLEHIINKLVVAIILAAIIMGSAIGMVAAANISVYGLQTLSFIGFFVSIVLGFIFVIVSLKSVKAF